MTTTESTIVSKFQASLDRLANLEDGWSGENSKAPAESVIAKFKEMLPQIAKINPNANLIPIDDGGIGLEWEDADATYIIEIEPNGLVFFHSENFDSGDLREVEDDYSPEFFMILLNDYS